MECKDGLYYYYFYPNGKNGGSKEIQNLLKYILNSSKENVVDDTTKKIHQYIEKIRNSPETEEAYMTWGDYIDIENEKVAINIWHQSIYELLTDNGEISENIKKRVEAEDKEDILKKLLKLAKNVKTNQEFEEKMESV